MSWPFLLVCLYILYDCVCVYIYIYVCVCLCVCVFLQLIFLLVCYQVVFFSSLVSLFVVDC